MVLNCAARFADYRMAGSGMLPVRWMAPECLDIAMFTPASDVWSMAVCFWEVRQQYQARLFYGCSYRFHLSGDNSRDRYIKGS